MGWFNRLSTPVKHHFTLLRSTGVLVFLCFLFLKMSFFLIPTNARQCPLHLSSYQDALMLKSFTSALRKKNILPCPECNHFRDFIIFLFRKKKYNKSAPAWVCVHSFPRVSGLLTSKNLTTEDCSIHSKGQTTAKHSVL